MKKAPIALNTMALTALVLTAAGTASAAEPEASVPVAALNPSATSYLQETEARLQEFDRIAAGDSPSSESSTERPAIAADNPLSSHLLPLELPPLEPVTPVASNSFATESPAPNPEKHLASNSFAAESPAPNSEKHLSSSSFAAEPPAPNSEKRLSSSSFTAEPPVSNAEKPFSIAPSAEVESPQALAAAPAAPERNRATPTNQVVQRRASSQSKLPEGLYGALSGDWRVLRNAQYQGLNVPGIGTIGTGSADFFSGFGLNAAVGYKIPRNNLRVEAQLAYGQNEVGTVELPAVPFRSLSAAIVNGKGSASTFSGFLNAYYDLNTGTNWQPYIGGGIALTRLSSNGFSVTYPGTNVTATVDEARWGFAYQVMAGTAYYLNPQMALTLGYRYFDPVGGNTFDTPLGEVRFKDGGAHNFEFGLRYFF